MLMFYDLKANKYLESSINSSRTVVLKASKGFVVSFALLILTKWEQAKYELLKFQISANILYCKQKYFKLKDTNRDATAS